MRKILLMATAILMLGGCAWLQRPVDPSVDRTLREASAIVEASPTNADAIIGVAEALSGAFGLSTLGLGLWIWRRRRDLKRAEKASP